MDTHGYSRILTDTHGYSWILTDTHGYSQILTDTHGTVCPIGPKGKARTHCYVCDANFAVRVKLRRHIRSGPLKPAPATCFYIFGISCETMRLSRLEVGWRKLSNETSELISFGGGEYFVASKRDCLVWGWRIFCSETSEIVSYGGGAGTHSIQSS